MFLNKPYRQVVSATEFRRQLCNLILQVNQEDQPIVVTVASCPKVVVSSLSYFEELKYQARR